MNRILFALALLMASVHSVAVSADDATMTAIGKAMSEGRSADAYRMTEPLAEAGDPDMQFAMSLFLESGRDLGVQLTPAERSSQARHWLGRAALQKNAESMKRLQQAFKLGELGLAKNPAAEDCWARVRAGRREPSACMSWLGEGK